MADLPLDPKTRVLIIDGADGSKERWISPADAASAGYTLVDLGDDWTPFIFKEHLAADGQRLPNRYRRVYVGLARNELDDDGSPLPAGQKNYLELYGIPPALSVLRARFLEDTGKTCADAPAPELKMIDPGSALAAPVKAQDRPAMTAAERRLTCEGFLTPQHHHRPGVQDEPFRQALRAFQQKQMIYEAHALRKRTVEALGRPLLDTDRASLIRALRERVIDAAGVLEDGTTDTKNGPASYLTMTGEKISLRNLADELTAQAVDQLGFGTNDGALAFFRRHPAQDFGHLLVGVKLPELPEYYSANMDLSIVIDRGDVWYDLPWDATGKRLPQPRKKYPSFTLVLKYRNQKIPLVRWRTTVGGWRAEQASDGYEYFRYKGSDVGPRVIRQVSAGPVWIAPPSTPTRSLVKRKQFGRHSEMVVNYDELGPGYLSAYGLVAGYFVVPGQNGRPDFDNGIRAHGSSDYLSIYSDTGFSHGCHRLPNHLAIRLYSFILRHRPMRVVGDLPLDMSRQFLRDNDVFELRIPSRGYAYQLDPPLPVDVLEGDIKGTLKTPVLTYVPKPGVRYPGPLPEVSNSLESRAGGVPTSKKPGAAEPEDEGTP